MMAVDSTWAPNHFLPMRRESSSRVAAIRRRDPTTLEAVVRETLPRLVRAARAAGLAEHDAYDAVQSTMLVFVQKADQFDGRASVGTWLFGILFRKIREQRRAATREGPVDDIDAVVDARFDAAGRWLRPPSATDAAATTAEIMRYLADCLDEVPERQRNAFVLREIEQLTTEEVCNVLEVSANNLGVMLFRARNRLRECLEAKGIRGSVDAEV